MIVLRREFRKGGGWFRGKGGMAAGGQGCRGPARTAPRLGRSA